MSVLGLVDKLIDKLMPPSLNGGLEVRKRVRLFLLSHLGGPILGLQIPLILAFLDPHPFPHVHILAASIAGFWAFPFLLKWRPDWYIFLASVSLLNLNFAVLWGAYNYGGAGSPFLLWYILIPLLAFFYLGGGVRAKVIVFAQIVCGLGTFCLVFAIGDVGAPDHIPMQDMVWPGLLSAWCATIYAFFMASYYSEVVDSQSSLIKEVESHQNTLQMLTAAKEETEKSKLLIEARNEELELAKARLEHTASHDWLTGLANRRYLEHVLSESRERCEKSGESLAVLHVDLDRFKQINDTLGHAVGDAMLNHVANILRNQIGKDDFVARVGGDEFIVVRRHAETGSLIELADSLIREISRPVPYMDRLCRFGACIGIAVEAGPDIRTDRLMVNSDTALYRAKMRGRNRAELFSEDLQIQMIESSRIGDDILRGLEQNEFVPFYQPQFDANTLELVGVEALVRWRHPTNGIQMPGTFLAAAAELNVVGAIDRSIMDRALEDLKFWKASNVAVPRISVNVSASRLNDETLISHLRRAKIVPGTLSFELVESIFLDDCDAIANDAINQIKELGIDIEIDDFGTGHASIVSLLKLNPKRLKIDRQFISPILGSVEHSRLVSAIIEMGKALEIDVIAEGVETVEQARLLRKLGCDVFQGFAFARPMPADELVQFIRGSKLRQAS